MLRRTLLSLSESRALRQWMERSPLAGRFTSRFVAGQSLEDGIAVLHKLKAEGLMATLDFLGENISSLSEARISRDTYMAALERMEPGSGTVSLKLTQFGLDLSSETCLENVCALAACAQQQKTRIEIDMEASEYVDRTLTIVERVQQAYPGHVRAVIQAYLYRSEKDIARLSALSIPVRLCKGAYHEPATVAFARKAEVDANYRKLMRKLLDEGTYPAIASHDEGILREAIRYIQEQRLAREGFEFQMLYGIRRDLQRELVASGYGMRLYVPYGNAWFPYFMRRLAERPANLLFLLQNLLR